MTKAKGREQGNRKSKGHDKEARHKEAKEAKKVEGKEERQTGKETNRGTKADEPSTASWQHSGANATSAVAAFQKFTKKRVNPQKHTFNDPKAFGKRPTVDVRGHNYPFTTIRGSRVKGSGSKSTRPRGVLNHPKDSSKVNREQQRRRTNEGPHCAEKAVMVILCLRPGLLLMRD